MSIENLKKILESEREEEMGIWDFCTGPVGYRNGHGNATDRLLPLLEKAVEILSEINIDNPSFEDSRLEWVEIQIDKIDIARIREFLAEFTKMTEIKKESE